MRYSIVIPCYNEEKNIAVLVEKFLALRSRDFELILVNNGSVDNTEKEIQAVAQKYKFIVPVNVKENKGYGYGILQGLKVAQGEYLSWMHADIQVEPRVYEKIFSKLKSMKYPQNIFIKGRRRGRPVIDVLFTMGMSLFETCYLRTYMFDINAQPTMLHRKSFKEWTNPPNDFSLDLYAYYFAKKRKQNIIRIEVRQKPRQHGSSSWNTGIASRIKLVKRVIQYTKKLKRNMI